MTDKATHSGYLLYHSIGAYPDKEQELAQAAAEFARIWAAPNDRQWDQVLRGRQDFIDHWRRIINAPERSLTTCDSVTDGLHKMIRALPKGTLKGKRVLVAADCFPSLHFLLAGLAQKMGFVLDTVPKSKGKPWVEAEDFMLQWGSDVGLALLTWVSSTTSARVDLLPLVAHGREMGSLIGVDITQAVGLLPFDVMYPRIDFVLSTSLKWMCGTPGAGILYVDPSIISELKPEGRGWFSQDDPFSWDLDSFDYAPDIRRFDGGTPNSMSAFLSVPALRWHAKQDGIELVAWNRKLSDSVIRQADAISLPLNSPRDAEKRGGSVMLRMRNSQEAMTAIQALAAEGLVVDARGPILRLSPGSMTAAQSTEKIFDILRKLKR